MHVICYTTIFNLHYNILCYTHGSRPEMLTPRPPHIARGDCPCKDTDARGQLKQIPAHPHVFCRVRPPFWNGQCPPWFRPERIILFEGWISPRISRPGTFDRADSSYAHRPRKSQMLASLGYVHGRSLCEELVLTGPASGQILICQGRSWLQQGDSNRNLAPGISCTTYTSRYSLAERDRPCCHRWVARTARAPSNGATSAPHSSTNHK